MPPGRPRCPHRGRLSPSCPALQVSVLGVCPTPHQVVNPSQLMLSFHTGPSMVVGRKSTASLSPTSSRLASFSALHHPKLPRGALRRQMRGAHGGGPGERGPHPRAAEDRRHLSNPRRRGKELGQGISMHPGLSQTSCVTVTSRCLSFLTGKMRRMVRESPSGA